jgi:hypothetical protein
MRHDRSKRLSLHTQRHRFIQSSTTSDTGDNTGLSSHQKDAPKSGSLVNEIWGHESLGGGGGGGPLYQNGQK